MQTRSKAPLSRIVATMFLLMVLSASGCTSVTALRPPEDRANVSTPATLDIQIDGSQRYQTIDGFGVNINGASWNDGKLAPVLDQLSKTMGSTIFRVILETADWETTNDNPDPQSSNWEYYDTIYESPKFQSLWSIIGYLEQNPKNTVLLNVMGWVPEWMGYRVINENAEDEWAEMIASVVYYGRNVKHLNLRLLSPTNEVDLGYPEGPSLSPEQHARLLNKLVTRLQALDMGDIRLVAPDTADIWKAPDYADKLIADPLVMDTIDHFSFHNYGGDSGPAESVVSSSGYPGRDYWITEFSQWCQGCDTGSQASDQWSFATGTADFLMKHLEQGAAAALIYDGFDSFYVHHRAFGYWGVLAFDSQTQSYTPRKRFYTAAQVFRFVRPGMSRINVSGSNSPINVLAFADPKTNEFTLVGHNPTNSTITLKGSLSAVSVSNPLAFYQTTVSSNLARGTNVSISGNSLSATIAPDSIFTLTTVKPE